MERVKLGEHLESFKKLPKEEYSLLEKACKSGLALTPYAIVGKGRETLKENKELLGFIEKLNESFPLFEKTTIKQRKLKNILEQNKEKRYKDYFDTSTEQIPYTCVAIDLFGGLGSLLGLAIYGMVYPLLSTGNPLNMTPGIATWLAQGLTQVFGCLVALGHCEKKDSDNYYGPSALVACTATYIKDRQIKRARLERSAKKSQKRLRKKIIQKRYGIEAYNQNWYKKIEKDLSKELLSCNENFPARFMQMERRLLPEDRLKLYKKVEATAQERVGQADYTQKFEKIEETHNIAGLANAAGVSIAIGPKEIKKRIKQSIPELKKKKQERIEQIQKRKEERINQILKGAKQRIAKEKELEKEKTKKEEEFEKKEIEKRKEFLKRQLD